mmetsp:Transcript_19642/g.58233  ORF Transcript_19642/g.58233 Transcript_19642/m.58233 type:complete len:336 (+) Transcript_19642:539-1546(+)
MLHGVSSRCFVIWPRACSPAKGEAARAQEKPQLGQMCPVGVCLRTHSSQQGRHRSKHACSSKPCLPGVCLVIRSSSVQPQGGGGECTEKDTSACLGPAFAHSQQLGPPARCFPRSSHSHLCLNRLRRGTYICWRRPSQTTSPHAGVAAYAMRGQRGAAFSAICSASPARACPPASTQNRRRGPPAQARAKVKGRGRGGRNETPCLMKEGEFGSAARSTRPHIHMFAHRAAPHALARSPTILLVSSSSSDTFLTAVASLVDTALMPVAILVAGCFASRATVVISSSLVGRFSHALSCAGVSSLLSMTATATSPILGGSVPLGAAALASLASSASKA